MEQLSDHDKRVLDTIFDPLQLMTSGLSVAKPEEEPNDIIENPEIADLVKRAIRASESGGLEEALQLFEEALAKAPGHPAVLNDRAQAFRLAGRVEEALQDLEKALDISKGRGQAGTNALCQRGQLYRLSGREEDAKRDFEAAAHNGSTFARAQLVQMNPYAAMCNAMLKKMNSNP